MAGADDALDSVDAMVLEGSSTGHINLILLELLARTGYSREPVFEDVTAEEHWKKPRNAPKEWVSKVKFDQLSHWDPRYDKKDTFVIPSAEKEVRDEIDRKAMLLKARSKLAKNEDKPADPLNP